MHKNKNGDLSVGWLVCFPNLRSVAMVFFSGIGNSGGRTWVGLEKLQVEL